MPINPARLRKGLGDYLRTNTWIIEFPLGIPGSTGIGPGDIDLRCKSVTPPSKTVEVMEVNIKGARDVPIGSHAYNSEFSIVVAETTDVKIHQLLKDWYDLVITDDQSRPGTRDDMETTVVLYKCDNNYNPVWKYVIHHVVLKGDEKGELSSEASPVDITLNFAYVYYDQAKVSV